ncbi:MAG: ArdC-like ssDNA-binding domain-containing protein [Sporichthyaceae bacterium]
MSRAESGDRLAAAHEHLMRAVDDLTTSEAWRRMLTVAARFPSYSANNVLLIGIQRPDATRVAGIRTWNSLDRRVRKGEKGIAILAPCLYRPRAGEPVAATTPAEPRGGEPVREGGAVARQLRGFRVVHVFDLAQTDGEPLPDVAPTILTGPAPREFLDRLINVVGADGYTVERGDCRGANGYTDFATHTVRVRDDVPEAQAAKTFSHELGHIRADHENRFLGRYGTSAGCRSQAEVEAESIGYLIATAAGLDATAYSVPYVAGWSGGNRDLLRESATRVLSTARTAIRDLGFGTDTRRAESEPAGRSLAGIALTHSAGLDPASR